MWMDECGVKVELISRNSPEYLKLARLLFTYRHLNAEKLEDMPATDLYEHHAQLLPGTRPWDATKKGRKTYSQDKKWWLSQIVQEGIKDHTEPTRENSSGSTISQKKYAYIFSEHRGKLMTDHKPLVHFLGSLYVEGIYARWAAELILLNFDIVHIPGSRNQIADALSRTIFFDPECEVDDDLNSLRYIDQEGKEPKWIWKDGVGGYAEFLARQRLRELEEAEINIVSNIKNLTGLGKTLSSENSINARLNFAGYECCSIDQIINSNLIAASQVDEPVWNMDLSGICGKNIGFIYSTSAVKSTDHKTLVTRYTSDPWWSEIYLYIKYQIHKKEIGVNLKFIFHRCTKFFIEEDIIFYRPNKQVELKRCVLQEEVAMLLWNVHDESGHWSTDQTIKQLRGNCWPTLAKDFIDTEDDALFAQLNFITSRHQARQIVIDRDDYRRTIQKDLHDTGVWGQTLVPGELVMLHDEKEAKKKL
ncbi:hypothetical protein GcM3_053039 [Golovinomyces cichoracearum]|uniref:Integrase zinc-binding domain-containing protein n=1 Tax=Golovinomyces cichoracearum TaxID=62708 RepID=A0A420IYT5_9PEZI|nr:hypothetical protein GcM3_053039 [Golovinomyces cichoracearum]